MNIAQIEPNSKVVNLVAKIASIEEPKETPIGKTVQEGIFFDNSGQVKFSLWEENVGKFKVGDKVIMSVGWCKLFQDELQVSTGRFGKINKVPAEKPE